jgi:uncharacterized surface protein with fasciclin (FAS1) repeats
VQAAGLESLFSETNVHVTVLAPDNDAFAEIPKADLEALLADKEALVEVCYHDLVAMLSVQVLAPHESSWRHRFHTPA